MGADVCPYFLTTTTNLTKSTSTNFSSLLHCNMAAALAQPTTYGCSPALLLSSKAAPSSAAAVAARSKSAPGESSVVSDVVVHPIVLLSVLDHHTRRQEGAGRVIGTLLGKRDGDRVSVVFGWSFFILDVPSERVVCISHVSMHNFSAVRAWKKSNSIIICKLHH